MNTRIGLFRPQPTLENYNALKALFIMCLNETENKCYKLCAYKYDQERNFSIAYHPVIEENKHKIVNTKKRILEELARIDRVNEGTPENGLKDLIQYGERLGKENVLSLFLTIFIGKLKKRWLPVVISTPETVLEIAAERKLKS